MKSSRIRGGFFFWLGIVFAVLCLALNAGAAERDQLYEMGSESSWEISSGIARFSPQTQSVVLTSYIGAVDGVCTLDETLDFRYFSTLMFDMTVSSDTAVEEPYTVELSLICLGGETSVSQVVFPSSSPRVTFNLADFSHLSSVTAIEFFITPTDGERGYLSFTLSNLRLGGKVDRDLSQRYLCADFAGDGAAVRTDSDGINFSVISKNAAVSGDVTVREQDSEVNALRLVYSSSDKMSGAEIRYEYADGAYTVPVSLQPGADTAIAVLPLPEKGLPESISFLFRQRNGQSLKIHSLCAVSACTPSEGIVGESISCILQEGRNYLVVSGTVPSEVANANSDAMLALYELDSYRELSAVFSEGITPIATYPMSTRFDFRVPVQSGHASGLLSKYAVLVYRNGSPTTVVVAGPTYLTVQGGHTGNTRAANAFKGVFWPAGTDSGELGVGTVILDVYLNDLISLRSIGQPHSVFSRYYYFSLDTVAELDRSIGSFSAEGADVILRLMVRNEEGELPYAFPANETSLYRALRADSWDSVMYLHATADFLISRYGGGDYGSISGLIVGEDINRPLTGTGMGDGVSLSEYVVGYGNVLRVLYASIQNRDADVTLYVPVGGEWSGLTVLSDTLTEQYDTPLLLYSLWTRLQNEGGMPLSLLIDGKVFSEEETNAKIPAVLAADNISAYLDTVRRPDGGSSGFDSVMFVWTPIGLGEEQLLEQYCLAYGLLYQSEVDVFAVNFSESDAYSKALSALYYIDTKYLPSCLPSGLGPYIYGDRGVTSEDGRLTFPILRELYTFLFSSGVPAGITGRYSYFDFSAGYDTQGWYAGIGCRTLESSPNPDGGRMLAADGVGTFSLYHHFEQTEDFSFLRGLLLSLAVQGEGNAQIAMAIGSREERWVISAEVPTGETAELFFDLPAEAAATDIAYMKITVSGDGVTGASLYRIEGLSDTMDSETLAGTVAASRTRTEAQSVSLRMILIVTAGGVLIASVCGIAVLGIHLQKKKKAGA